MRAALSLFSGTLFSGTLLSGTLLAGILQDPDQDKLDKYVRDACGTNPIIRMQASRRVVKGGARGLAACQRFIAANGSQALSAELVEALGRFDLPDAKVLLRTLFSDKSFLWRPQAMRGLANKPATVDRALFTKACTDVSWLVRRAALSGSAKTKGRSANADLISALSDPDRRVQVTAAGLLLERSRTDGLSVLLAALDIEESFFGEDFGARLRTDASRYLRRAAGNDFEYRARANRKDRRPAIDRFLAWAEAKLEEPIPLPEQTRHEFVLGFERRSCQLGDTYLRVDRNGQLWRGLFEPKRIEITANDLSHVRELSSNVPPSIRKVHGRLRCELVRFAGLGRPGESTFSVRCAKGAVPKELETLAKAWRGLTR